MVDGIYCWFSVFVCINLILPCTATVGIAVETVYENLDKNDCYRKQRNRAYPMIDRSNSNGMSLFYRTKYYHLSLSD